MSNGSKTREAEQRAQIAEQQTKAAQATAEAERIKAANIAQETVQITPEARGVLDRANKNLSAIDSGDYSGVPGVMRLLSGVADANKTMSRMSPTGSAALATDVANPTLLAMNDQRIKAETANQTATGVDAIVQGLERDSINDIMNVSGMDLSAKTGAANFMFTNAGLAGNNADRAAGGADRAMQNYINERNRRGFWESAALGAIGAGGQVASSYFGKKG